MSLDGDRSKIPHFIPSDFGLGRANRRDRNNSLRNSSVDNRAANLRGDRFSSPSADTRHSLHSAPVNHTRNQFAALQLFGSDDARPVADGSTGRALGRALARLNEANMKTLGI